MSDIRPPAYRAMTGTRVAMGPWQLLAAAFAAQAAISFVELGVPILAPFIKEGLGLSAFALGILVGALNVGRFAGSVPAGQLADRLGERIVLVASGLGLLRVRRPRRSRLVPADPRRARLRRRLQRRRDARRLSRRPRRLPARVARAADGDPPGRDPARRARRRHRAARCSRRRGAGAGRWRPRRSSRCSERRSSRPRGCRLPWAATRAGARTWRSSPGRPRSSTRGSGRSSSWAASTRC